MGINPLSENRLNDLLAFQDTAQSKEDRLVFVNTRQDGELGKFRNTAGNRCVVWVRKHVTRRKVQRQEITQAYQRLIDSIAVTQHTVNSGELSRVKTLLGDDMRARKPLSSYKIRQVLNSLDANGPEHVLQNRTVAKYYSTTDYLDTAIALSASDKPRLSALKDVPELITDQDKKGLSEKIYNRLMTESAGREAPFSLEEGEEIAREEVKELLDNFENDLNRGASLNAMADTNAVSIACKEVSAALDKAEASLASMKSLPSRHEQRTEVGFALSSAQRVLTLMHYKAVDIKTALSENDQLDGHKDGLIRSLQDRLAIQHQRLADLATNHDLDLFGSTAFARGIRMSSAETAPGDRANVYDPGSMTFDPAGIGESEVHGIMPHLLSDREKPRREGGGLTPDVQKGDILHAKQAFLETQHNLEARGRGLTDNEVEQLDRYIDSSHINKPLGMNRGDASCLVAHYKTQYEGMQSGLAKLPDEQAVVYRGTTTSPETIGRFRDSVGGLFTSTAFLSTSASPNYAKLYTEADGKRNQAAQNCEVRFQILGRTGKNISGISDLKERREYPDADIDPAGVIGCGEILFRPGTDFRLVAFAKHPHREVYGMVLREESQTGESLRDLQDANIVAKTDSIADGLANEFMELWDSRMASRELPPDN